MKFNKTGFPGVYLIELDPKFDSRGYFVRTYCTDEFKKINHQEEFVQINQSFNLKKGTLRGLHFQKTPFEENKLVRCIKGGIFDIIIDIRNDSATFLKSESFILTEENLNMIFIPGGFAHGFQTLSDHTMVLYHHSQIYRPEMESGLNFKDPLLSIKLPEAISEISERDLNFPFLKINS